MSNRSHARSPLNVPYPASPFMKYAFQSPILLWRLGLGPLVGRQLMILTTTGRVSGRPRRTAIEFHEYRGRKYIYSAWGERAQWYRNIMADPLVTIQTAKGAERVLARRVRDDEELAEAFDFMAQNPLMQRWVEAMGVHFSREGFLAARDDLYLVTFDPTDAPTPPPQEADLTWVWSVAGALLSLALRAYFARYQRRRQRRRA